MCRQDLLCDFSPIDGVGVDQLRVKELLARVGEEDVEEVIVAGDYAIQWGTFSSTSRSRENGELFAGGGKLMRILQRQADGSWKMHRPAA